MFVEYNRGSLEPVLSEVRVTVGADPQKLMVFTATAVQGVLMTSIAR